jgi:hypothetical protein
LYKDENFILTIRTYDKSISGSRKLGDICLLLKESAQNNDILRGLILATICQDLLQHPFSEEIRSVQDRNNVITDDDVSIFSVTISSVNSFTSKLKNFACTIAFLKNKVKILQLRQSSSMSFEYEILKTAYSKLNYGNNIFSFYRVIYLLYLF